MPINYLRQSSIINIKDYRENTITIVGCGAIGSFLAISLAKMGLTKFILYDFDKVEEHNLPNQFFAISDLGERKDKATSKHMKEFNDECVISCLGKYDGENFKSPIVISCVDKMSVRRQIFDSVCKDNTVQLFIDCRMAKFQGQIYTIDMEDKVEIENYKKSLFEDRQAVQLRCTERSIVFTVLGLASLVCNNLLLALLEQPISNYLVIDYSVPQIM